MKLKIWDSEIAKSCDESQLFIDLKYIDNKDSIRIIIVDKKGNDIDCGIIAVVDQSLKCLVSRIEILELIPVKTDLDHPILTIKSNELQEMKKKKFGEDFTNIMAGKMIDGKENETKDVH
jgi:hypothetical protein